jgi:hypothetical protein
MINVILGSRYSINERTVQTQSETFTDKRFIINPIIPINPKKVAPERQFSLTRFIQKHDTI